MPEFFIVANSNAAPMVPDQSTYYQEAESSASAIERFVADYKHPFGLYSAAAYYSADEFHKGRPPAVRWLSHKALVAQSERKGQKGQLVM